MPPPVKMGGAFVPANAIAFGAENQPATAVSVATPLPVCGDSVVKSQAPAITASAAYASGNLIGGKLTFGNFARVSDVAAGGLIQMGMLLCKANVAFAAELVLFHTDPTNTTFTDKAAFGLAVADFDKILGRIAFATADWTAYGTPSFAQATQLAMAYKVATGQTDIFGALVSRGTPTFASASDLKIIVKSLLD